MSDQLSLGASIKPEIKFIDDKRLVKPEQLGALANWLEQTPELVVDYESDGLHVRQGHRAFMAGFYAPDKGAKCVDFRLTPQAVELLKSVLPRRTGTTIAHNLVGAEHAFSGAMGFELGGRLWDNQHAIFAIDQRQERGQKEYGKNVLKLPQPYAHALRDWMDSHLGTYKEGHELNPLELEVPYSCEDVETAWAIYQDTKLKCQKLGMTELVLTDSELTRAVYEMENTGLRIDVPLAERLLGELTAEVAVQSKKLTSLVGHTVDVAAHQALYGLFFGELGLKGDFAKRDSLDDEALNFFIDTQCGPLGEAPDLRKCEIIDTVSLLRELDKLRGTYLYPWIYEHQVDGFLLPHLDMNGARTRRFSSLRPNLQNIPIRSKLAKRIREAIVREPGWREWAIDYSQIEYRLMVHYCNDPLMVKGYRDNPWLDLHQEVSDMLEVDRDTIGKHLNFGIVYGLGEESLARKMRCSLQRARELLEWYHRRFPGIKPWRREVIAEASRRGYARDPFGGRRYLEKHEAHKAVNTICQMGGADVARRAITRIRPVLKQAGGKMRMTIHDDVMFATPESLSESQTLEVLREVRRVAEDFPMLRVPIRVQFKKFEDNWLNTEKVKLD
jgi:DNA polymerase-1